MKKALIYGAGGFIGNHLVSRLKEDAYYIIGVDLKYPEFNTTEADKFIIHDLREKLFLPFHEFDEVYCLAADMGGAGYIFTGEHDANVMHNSAMINLNLLDSLHIDNFKGKVFYSSSACAYPAYNQEDENNPKCTEDSIYPAAPDSEYGWEKLFSERLYMAYARNYGINVRIARFHNIFGVKSCFNNGKEKFPAAAARKVSTAKDGDKIEIWGDGKQTRSFLCVRECVEGILRLMQSDFNRPVNIGSDEMISVNDLAELFIEISGKKLIRINIPTDAMGVRGRNSDNTLIKNVLGWAPQQDLKMEMTHLYNWVNYQVWQ